MAIKEILYKDINEACKGIHTTSIKGKEYVPVNERVTAFRKVYTTDFITTDIISSDDKSVLMKTEVGFYINVESEDGSVHQIKNVLATGYASEEKNSSYINKTSYIENCETSAVGRALGFAGFGIDSSIASSEEIIVAEENQASLKPISKKEAGYLRELLSKFKNLNMDMLLLQYNVDDLEELTAAQYAKIIRLAEKELTAQPKG